MTIPTRRTPAPTAFPPSISSVRLFVIPKEMRDRLGIVPGDEVDFALENNAVRIEPIHEMQNLRGRLAGLGLTEAVEADRRAEQDR